MESLKYKNLSVLLLGTWMRCLLFVTAIINVYEFLVRIKRPTEKEDLTGLTMFLQSFAYADFIRRTVLGTQNTLYKNIEDEIYQKVKNVLKIRSSCFFAK